MAWPWNLVRGHSRSFKLVPFESLATVSYLPSIVIMALCSIISEIKRDIGRKSRLFHSPLAFVQSEYCHNVRYGKLRIMWLSDGEKSLRICLAISREYRHVIHGQTDWRTDRQTDRQTDGRTSCGSIVGILCIVSRGRNDAKRCGKCSSSNSNSSSSRYVYYVSTELQQNQAAINKCWFIECDKHNYFSLYKRILKFQSNKL